MQSIDSFNILRTDFCLEKVYRMKTSAEEFDRGGGGSPPCVGLTSSALPAVQTSLEAKNLPIGVSTHCEQPATSRKDTNPHWYALRCSYGREKKAYEYFLQKGIKAFYPTIAKKIENDGEKRHLEESRIPNIFFAYDSFESLKQYVYDNVHDETKHIRFYYNQHHDGTKEPLIIPDWQINSLMLICDSEEKDIILEPITATKFLKGQRVIVKEGPFAGVEGIVARFMGQQRVGISIEGLFTMTTAYVPSAFLERKDTANNHH